MRNLGTRAWGGASTRAFSFIFPFCIFKLSTCSSFNPQMVVLLSLRLLWAFASHFHTHWLEASVAGLGHMHFAFASIFCAPLAALRIEHWVPAQSGCAG